MASKRKALCVDQKVALIHAIEKGEKKSDVGKRFGFSPSTVATDKILHVPSIQQALDAAKLLEMYFLYHDDPKLCQNMGEIHRKIQKQEEQKEDEEEAQPDVSTWYLIVPSIQQALDAAKLLEKYLSFHEDDPKLCQNMGEIHRKIQKQYEQNKKVQTKITDYFK